MIRVALFTRLPVPGTAKTRLIPSLGADGAARVHRRLVARTMATLRASGLPFEVRTTGGDHAAFADWLGGDVRFVEQGDGDLGERLARVPAPAILIGSDCPALTPAILREAAAALETMPAVIGPASDGGYYLLGYRAPAPFAFAAMPWSTATVGARTLARFAAQGLKVAQLPTLADIDRPEDLLDWPELTA